MDQVPQSDYFVCAMRALPTTLQFQIWGYIFKIKAVRTILYDNHRRNVSELPLYLLQICKAFRDDLLPIIFDQVDVLVNRQSMPMARDPCLPEHLFEHVQHIFLNENNYVPNRDLIQGRVWNKMANLKSLTFLHPSGLNIDKPEDKTLWKGDAFEAEVVRKTVDKLRGQRWTRELLDEQIPFDILVENVMRLKEFSPKFIVDVKARKVLKKYWGKF